MRTIGVKLTADTTGYISGLQRAGAATKDFTGQMDRAAKTGKLDHIADQAAKFGLAGVAAFGLVVKSAADFDKQMSEVQAATHGSATEIAQLRAASIEAGKSSQFSATQAADGVTQLAKAGVSTADILGGGLKGALDLAAAGQLDVADAAETTASALTQFNLKGSQVPHVADLLAAAAGKAQGSVGDMGYALSQSGLVAAQFGLSIEDTTGTLAAFASAGLIGSDAGTSFKTMLLALANPTGESKKEMDALGIAAYDTSGKFVGVTNLAGQLQAKLGGLTQAQRDATLAQIFGTDAIRAANVLYKQGSTGIQGWIDKTNDAGYAAETASKMTDNLAGDVERLKGSLETMAIEAGSGANGGLRLLVSGVGSLVDQFSQLPPAVGSGLTILAGVGGVALLALAGFIKLRKGLAETVEQLNAMGPAGEKAASRLEKVAAVAGKVAAAFTVLEVVGVVADHFGAAAVNSDKLAASLTNLSQTGKSAGEITDVFGEDLERFADTAHTADAASHGFWGGLNDLLNTVPGVGKVVDTLNERIYGLSFSEAKDDMVALDGALVDFMNTTQDATKASELWNRLLSQSGMDTEQFAALLPNAYKQLGALNTEAMKAKDGLDGAGASAKDAAGGIRGVGGQAVMTAAELKKLTDEVEKFISGQLSADRAAINFQSGMVALTKELMTGSRTLGLNTAEGRKNRSAVLDQISTIDDLRKARLAQGASLDSVNKKYLTDIDGLRKSMLQAGFSKKSVDELISSYKKIPGKVNTDVSVTGAKGVAVALNTLGDMQKALKNGTVPPGGWGANAGALNKALNDPKMRAHGGPVNGPGSETSDSIPAMLSNNEYVVRASSAKKLGTENLNYINKYGELPGFAGGGAVRWPFPVSAAMARVPSKAEAMAAVVPATGPWPSSPSAQRGDSGVWKSVVALIKSTGPLSGSFGNAYRPGDPLWHGSGRAVDWMGYNQDRLAQFLAARRPLELIHRTATRDYAYTRGVNKGSFNNALMQAHRNHVHIAMKDGGVIREPVIGVGASGASYSFAERGPETVRPGVWASGAGRGGVVHQHTHVTVEAGYVVSEQDLENKITRTIDRLRGKGRF